jgi:uncharacterized protein (UPF0332 family)
MNPETAESIAYAQKLLGDAFKMLDGGLPGHAARTAYLACFHAARAYSFERSGQVAKTHKGVQSEFYRLSKDDGRVDPDLRAFLARAYAYKATADYETGPEDSTTPEDARDAVETAERFVTEFARLTPGSGLTAG